MWNDRAPLPQALGLTISPRGISPFEQKRSASCEAFFVGCSGIRTIPIHLKSEPKIPSISGTFSKPPCKFRIHVAGINKGGVGILRNIPLSPDISRGSRLSLHRLRRTCRRPCLGRLPHWQFPKHAFRILRTPPFPLPPVRLNDCLGDFR